MNIKILRDVWHHIQSHRRRQLFGLSILVLLVSFVEILSIGAVVPYLSLISEPDRILAYPVFSKFIKSVGVVSRQEFLFLLTAAFILISILASILRLALVVLQTRLGHAIGADFSVGIYRRILNQPYIDHLNKNSSDVIADVSVKAKAIVGSAILPLMTIVNSGILLTIIFIALVYMRPFITLVAFGALGGVYISIVFASKKKVMECSKEIDRNQSKVIKIIQESLGGIRDVLLDKTQELYCSQYDSADGKMRKAVADSQIISVAPRYLIEMFGIVLITTMAYILLSTENQKESAIATIGLFAMSAQRMLPLLQQVYSSFTAISIGRDSVLSALKLMNMRLPAIKVLKKNVLNFKKSITLKEVSFAYSYNGLKVLSDLNLKIEKGSRLGIIGKTGGGKSTLLDVLMGLITPTDGQIFVDEECLDTANLSCWQERVSHVPQNIYLSDATIAENIAFGVQRNEINFQKIQAAAELAQLSEYIESLDFGYETMVGERGVRLSGGQRQRIGIARALYRNSDVIIFDEATSSLDSETEEGVMDAIRGLSRELTLIVVAHRLSTLKFCDEIIEVSDGGVIKRGSYENLSELRGATL